MGGLSGDVERQERVRRGAADVEEEGAAGGEDRVDGVAELADPREVLGAGPVVGVARVRDLPVVGWAGHDHVRPVRRDAAGQAGDRVLAPEDHGARRPEGDPRVGPRGGHRPGRAAGADSPTGPVWAG